jgi:hypothetical protein
MTSTGQSNSAPSRDPATTPEELFTQLSSAKPGDTVLIAGEWKEPLHIANYWIGKAGAPVTIDGMNKTYLRKGLGIESCGYLKVKSMEVNRGSMGNVHLSNSYKDTLLQGIELEDLYVPNANGRGIFLGAYRCRGLRIRRCHIPYNTYGTHGIYLSGGHWSNSTEPIMDTKVIGCNIGFGSASRWAFQANGRFQYLSIEDCTLPHYQLGGISLKGCRDVFIHNNLMYGSNRGIGVSIHDYAEQWAPYYNNFETDEDQAAFLATHWGSERISIVRNTMIVGPKQFPVDPYHKDDPLAGHPVVQINNQVQGTPWLKDIFPSFLTKTVYIIDNVMWSPNGNMVEPWNEEEAMETHVIGNMAWCPDKPPYIGQFGRVGELANNTWEDPDFNQLPNYDFVDLGVEPNYDFSKFRTSCDAFSMRAYQNHKGKIYPVPVLGNNDRVHIGE